MKAITCEVCGGNELVKEDGLFVCQHCGTKYSTEEAQKLYSKDIVDVKVDQTDKLANLFIIAERNVESENYEGAYEYYKEILKLAPNDYRPMVYVPALYILNAKIINQTYAGNLKQLLDASPAMFDNILQRADKADNARKMYDFFDSVFKKADSEIRSYSWDEDVDISVLCDSFLSNAQFAVRLGEFLTDKFPDESDLSKNGVELWKWVINHYKANYVLLDKRSFYEVVEKIQKYESGFKAVHKDDEPKTKVEPYKPQTMTSKPKSDGIGSKWWFIVLMFIVFWPIGLFLMIRKLVKD